jgi:hypothetical protein
MRQSKKLLLIITLILLVFGLASCQKDAKPPVYEEDLTMHIGAWVSPSTVKDDEGNYKYITLEQYQRIKDSGINVIYALYEHIDLNATLLALDLSEQVGIEYYVRDSRVAGLFQDIFDANGNVIQSEYEDDLEIFLNAIEPYKDHPAFKGHLIVDEPSADLYKWLGFYHEVYQEYLPDKDFYVNLFPTYASLAARGDRDYEDYIGEYIEVVKPKFVSYDHYPLMLFYEESVLTDDYLLNLEIVATKSKEAGLPFWLFLQSVGYFNITGTQRRDITEADLRFQSAVAMAYGTKGIQHFTYWTPDSGGIESFSDAFITKDGEKTPTYDAGTKVNHEILSFDHVYLSFDWQSVMTYSTTPDFPNTNFRMINTEDKHKRIKSFKGTEDVLMGTFKGQNKEDGFMVVNFTDPAFGKTNDVTITFNDATHALVYIDGVEQTVKLNKGKLTLNLASGSSAFVIPY